MEKMSPGQTGCCQIEAVVTVDERGQMVLPKDLRKRMGMAPGDKLALVAWERGDRICCLSLFPTGELNGVVRDILEPMVAGTEEK